jgi:hypothetical protein
MYLLSVDLVPDRIGLSGFLKGKGTREGVEHLGSVGMPRRISQKRAAEKRRRNEASVEQLGS